METHRHRDRAGQLAKRSPRIPMADDESWRVPSIVQELAATVQEPPSRYLIPEQDRRHDQLAGVEMPDPVPTIDLQRLLASDDSADAEATKLRSALLSWGFFLVTNHGIATSLMDDMMAASREFFRKPLEEKQVYSNLIEGKKWQLEGYGNDPVKTQDQILDWCDRLHLRVEPEAERNLDRWPGHPESFRGLLHEYTMGCKRVKDGILRAMASLLELDDDDGILGQFGDKGSTTNARFNYYPACPRPELVLGIRPHSDVVVLTLLLADEHVGGLHFQRDGTWYCVPAVRDRALLVNVGVSLEIMSNGIFKGPVHRVVTNSEKERMSLAMFYGTDLEKEIEPIAELLDEKRPARYKKIKFRDLVAAHYEYFSKRERVIESLKI
ncbi:codeine O-demethylase-like isoform X2 [Miscanthus floridulus]|uniref:codeine O-demethylase-like isoform X2 n=1 Tax=Miscanthus floridulus TaxID=154761 RepID=UPI003459D8C9